MGYEILACQKGDRLYPKRFVERNGLPEKFFYKGDISFLNDFRAVAVIGSRNALKDSILNAYMSGQYAAMEGFVVVNGLAVGCDTAALRGALRRLLIRRPSGLSLRIISRGKLLSMNR